MIDSSVLSRRGFLKIVSAMAAQSALSTGLSAQGDVAAPATCPPKPNIVIIFADDQRFDALGCMGHSFAQTPHTDRLAAEGTLFRNALVSTPLCGPNRACLFTGCFAHNHHLRHNGTDVPQPAPPMPVPCFPALLRDVGYRTALFGKFHEGDSSYPDHGFTHFEPCRNPYIDPEFQNEKGQWIEHQGHLDYLVTEKADAWIRNAAQDGPFLAVLSHVAPHMPIMPPDDKKDLYRDAQPQRRPNVADTDSKDKAPLIQEAQGWFRSMRQTGKIPSWTWPAPFSDEQLRDRMRLNRVLDDSVGRIYQTLQEMGQLDNTVFVYHSDNGYYLGEHGLSEKYYPYEEGLRVPLIIRYPKISKPAQASDRPVYTLDLAPTLLELAGVQVPTTVDGRSLVPLLQHPAETAWRDTTFHEFFYHKGLDPRYTWQAIRSDRWKYVRFEKSGFEELYDLKRDPYEMTNLAGDAGCRETLHANRLAFERLAKETKAQPITLAEPTLAGPESMK